MAVAKIAQIKTHQKVVHRCYKHIACTEENHFYYSFMNAATIGYDGEPNNLYETSINASLLYNNLFYRNINSTNPKGKETIYPACVYEINACNDTDPATLGRSGGGCYKKRGCIDGFEDMWDHGDIEGDWL